MRNLNQIVLFSIFLCVFSINPVSAGENTFPDESKTYEIKEFTKNERVAVGSDGNLLRWGRTGGKDQEFKFVKVEETTRRTRKKIISYMIKNVQTGKFLTVNRATGNISAGATTGGNRFTIVSQGGNKVRIKLSRTGNRHMAVGSNGNILRWDATGKNDQLFELIEK